MVKKWNERKIFSFSEDPDGFFIHLLHHYAIETNGESSGEVRAQNCHVRLVVQQLALFLRTGQRSELPSADCVADGGACCHLHVKAGPDNAEYAALSHRLVDIAGVTGR